MVSGIWPNCELDLMQANGCPDAPTRLRMRPARNAVSDRVDQNKTCCETSRLADKIRKNEEPLRQASARQQATAAGPQR
jgi:hypothetical protein